MPSWLPLVPTPPQASLLLSGARALLELQSAVPRFWGPRSQALSARRGSGKQHRRLDLGATGASICCQRWERG